MIMVPTFLWTDHFELVWRPRFFRGQTTYLDLVWQCFFVFVISRVAFFVVLSYPGTLALDLPTWIL